MYIVYVIYVKSKKISSRNFQGRIQEIMKKDNRDENWEEEKLFNCGRETAKLVRFLSHEHKNMNLIPGPK